MKNILQIVLITFAILCIGLSIFLYIQKCNIFACISLFVVSLGVLIYAIIDMFNKHSTTTPSPSSKSEHYNKEAEYITYYSESCPHCVNMHEQYKDDPDFEFRKVQDHVEEYKQYNCQGAVPCTVSSDTSNKNSVLGNKPKNVISSELSRSENYEEEMPVEEPEMPIEEPEMPVEEPQNSVRQQIQDLNIDLYYSDHCGYCTKLKGMLANNGVLDVINLRNTSDPSVEEYMQTNSPECANAGGVPCSHSLTTGKVVVGSVDTLEEFLNGFQPDENFQPQQPTPTQRAQQPTPTQRAQQPPQRAQQPPQRAQQPPQRAAQIRDYQATSDNYVLPSQGASCGFKKSAGNKGGYGTIDQFMEIPTQAQKVGRNCRGFL